MQYVASRLLRAVKWLEVEMQPRYNPSGARVRVESYLSRFEATFCLPKTELKMPRRAKRQRYLPSSNTLLLLLLHITAISLVIGPSLLTSFLYLSHCHRFVLFQLLTTSANLIVGFFIYSRPMKLCSNLVVVHKNVLVVVEEPIDIL